MSVLFTLAAVYWASSSAWALTAKDVLEKMDEREFGAYIIASVEMAAFLAHAQGDAERSACIMKWWFDTPDTKMRVISAFARFEDRAPQPILYVLMNKACGNPGATRQ